MNIIMLQVNLAWISINSMLQLITYSNRPGANSSRGQTATFQLGPGVLTLVGAKLPVARLRKILKPLTYIAQKPSFSSIIM